MCDVILTSLYSVTLQLTSTMAGTPKRIIFAVYDIWPEISFWTNSVLLDRWLWNTFHNKLDF